MNNKTLDSPIRILLVEDSEHDALAFHRAFSKCPESFKITHLVRADKVRRMLEINLDSFDILVSDFHLPGMSGFELFKDVKTANVKIPFIILTGTGSESLAVEALKYGVDDYIIKDPSGGYLKLLPVVIPDVIRKYHSEIAREWAEQALRESEKRYKDLSNLLPQTVFEVDLEGHLLYLNRNGFRFFGCSHHELNGHLGILDFFSLDDRQRFEQDLQNSVLDKVIEKNEYELHRHDKEPVSVLIYTNPIMKELKPVGLRGIIVDITALKKAEAEREKLIVELQEAIRKIKTLQGLIPICAACKKIRDDQGYWSQVEVYFQEHTDAIFSHSICPDCAKELYPELIN